MLLLSGKDYHRDAYSEDGHGGLKMIFTPLKRVSSASYIVKVQKQGQSVNEYVGQKILEAMGYDHIPVAMIQHNEHYYGALEFMENLKQIDVSKTINGAFVELLTINTLFDNYDSGEIYTNGNGALYSIDFGETIFSGYNAEKAMWGDVEQPTGDVSLRLNWLQKFFCDTCGYPTELVEDAIANCIEKFLYMNIDLTGLDGVIRKGVEQTYYNRIISIKNELRQTFNLLENQEVSKCQN